MLAPVLTVVVVMAVVLSRGRWMPFVGKHAHRGLLATFMALLLLTFLGALAWYWWQQPSTTFYGAQWQDATVEQDWEAIERMHSP